ncbi:MAG: hypothetical protein K0R27_4275 [Xanthobacteraceae bacterium]|jgi:hypothetical protein|nr:hypothetical protein [Xanthobacteraceae bacterium]
MAKFVIFGVKGDARVWLADLDGGTVVPVDPAEVEKADAAEAGFLDAAIKARQFGYTLVKDVDLAVATTTRSDAAAAHMSC